MKDNEKGMTGQIETSPAKGSNEGKDVKSVLKDIVKYLLPAGVSAAMIVWLFSKVKFSSIVDVMREGCNYWWLLLMCLVLVVSRSIRGLRWGIQLRAAGVKRMPAFAEMVSIYGAYALNLLFTGVGEAWRCLYVARRQKADLATVIGTDLGDRISDAVMIVCLVISTLFLARPALDKFLDHYRFGEQLVRVFSSPWLWIGVAVVICGLIFLIFSKSQNKVLVKIRTAIKQLWDGFKILFTMKHQVVFWSETLGIWIAYFLMTYLCFFAFPFTRSLITPELGYGLLPGLVVFIFGSLSIAVPATGGLGPWNIAVMFALTLYGVRQTDAATYAMVVWAFQTVTQILMGLVSAVYITLCRDREEAEKLNSSAE